MVISMGGLMLRGAMIGKVNGKARKKSFGVLTKFHGDEFPTVAGKEDSI